MEILKPPPYCPEALATDVGWINPRNGELLVTVKNLRQLIKEAEQSQVKQPIVDNREDDRSTTQKVLDQLTQATIKQSTVDDRSPTQKSLDTLTEQLTSVTITDTVDGKSIDLVVKDTIDVQEEIPAKKKPGRPKKQKEKTNEQE
jgi:ABC-type hemin transport system substrate-binding protein